jgi:hypothetical protein
MTDAADASVQVWTDSYGLRADRFAAYHATFGSGAAAWACCQVFFEPAAAHARGLQPGVHGGVLHVEEVLKACSAAI